MKTVSNQRSILSFFGPPKNVDLGSSASKKEEAKELRPTRNEEDSPVKKASRRRTRTIQSDSEDEDMQPSVDRSSGISSPEKKKVRIESPKRSEVIRSAESPQPSTSKQKVGFSPETVPPLRKTARKQMSRKDDSTEERQLEVIKKLKTSPDIKENENKSKPNEKTPKRTNSLDKFVFIKTPRSTETVSSDSKKTVDSKTNDVSPTASENKLSSSPIPAETDTKPRKPLTPSNSLSPKTPKNKSYTSKTNKTTPSSDTKKTPSSNTKKTSPSDTMKTPNSKNPSSKDKSATKTARTSLSLNSSNDAADTLENSSPTPPSNTKKTPPSNTKKTPKSKKSSSKTKSASKSAKTSTSSNSSNDDADTNKNSSPKSSTSSTSPSTSPEKLSTPSDEKTLMGKTKIAFTFGKSSSDKDDKGSFNPSKHHYHPVEDASWKRGQDVPFAAISKTFQLIEDTSGRLKTIEILANFLRSVIVLSPGDLLFSIYLCLNKVAPSFEGIETGVGEIYVCRAVAQATGRSVSMIKSDIAEKGDLGIVAEQSRSNQPMMFQPARLTVKKVFNNVKEIALMSGQASQNKKIDKIKSLFVACKGPEARYLIRLFGGKLRIGLAEQSVLQAIAQACYLTPPDQEYPPEIVNRGKGLSAESLKNKVEEYASILKTTYCECPTFDSIIPILLAKGMTELPNHCKLEPGIPLKPMLAHPTKGVSEILKRFEKSKFTCEYKYDGERAQIHMKEDGTVSIFSRNQENNTSKYPDIINRLKGSLGPDVKSCVLDSEAVAFDVNESKILPFQILSTRKRKDANEKEIKVQVCVFPFDLLYLNGRNLVTETFEVRRQLLRENFVEKEGQFVFAKSMDSTNTEDIEVFLEESIKGNCEGLMVKSLDVEATYEIAKRSRNWLKLKKDYLEGVGDTIDVVVIGGFVGKGKRTGTYGGFLLACYDPENEEFQSLCKIGTGFSDDDLQQHTHFFKDHLIDSPKSYYRYDNNVAPDQWFDAVQVWEIKCADLSISPVHKAAIGIVDPEKGISLRFPRFLKIRDDKSPEDATSASQIADLYRNQDQVKNQNEGTTNEEDFY